jgi:hypothetical protein
LKCDKCNATIEQGEERQHNGQNLCEDCYIDALSPLKACDPWAVHSAKSLEKLTGSPSTLTPLQSEILKDLERNGPIEPPLLLQKLGAKVTMPQLEREFATLRHMERVRGEKRDGKVYWRLW